MTALQLLHGKPADSITMDVMAVLLQLDASTLASNTCVAMRRISTAFMGALLEWSALQHIHLLNQDVLHPLLYSVTSGCHLCHSGVCSGSVLYLRSWIPPQACLEC